VSLFLTAEDLRALTGFAIKTRQIAQLRIMGIPFRINGCGRPVVTVTAVDGRMDQQPIKPAWQPAVLQGGRQGG